LSKSGSLLDPEEFDSPDMEVDFKASKIDVVAGAALDVCSEHAIPSQMVINNFIKIPV